MILIISVIVRFFRKDATAMNILVSACLMGVCCRYDQKSVPDGLVIALRNKHQLIPVCPEQLGGLSTPRCPAEIKDGRVVTKEGKDVTANYELGAEMALKIAKDLGCRAAILKERSPSCGCGEIYDGSFSGNKIVGNGVTAKLLIQNGICVVGESKADMFL